MLDTLGVVSSWGQFIATVAVALVVQRFAARSAKAQALRDLSSQWQDYNLAVLTNSNVAELLSKNEIAGLNGEEIAALYSLFFTLTSLHQLYWARRDMRAWSSSRTFLNPRSI